MPATRHLVGLIGLATLLGACTAAPAALPIAVYTEDEALPFVAVDEAGTVIAFHAEPVSGAPTGLTIFTADDRVGHLEIDPATGHPAFWEADGYVVTFSNVRAELGLVDLGVIAPDGSTGQALDFELPPLSDVGSSTEPLTDAEAGSRWLEMLGALDVAVTLTGCVGGLIVTGGAAFGGASVPVAAVPLFASAAASGAATVYACAASVVKLRALRAANVHATAVNDVVLGPIDLGRQIAECGLAPGVWNCMKIASEVVRFRTHVVVAQHLGSYLALRHRPAGLTAYCCNGPRQIAVGESGRWRAAVVDGLGAPPFTYTFELGDGSPETVLVSSSYGLEAQHTYFTEGEYSLDVRVTDRTGIGTTTSAHGSGPLSTFVVRAYGPLAATCCALPAGPAVAGELATLAIDIEGGRLPYTYTVAFHDGSRVEAQTVGDVAYAFKQYDEPGEHEVRVSVADDDGTVVEVPPFVLTVEPEPGEERAAHCTFTSTVGPNPFQYDSLTYCYAAAGWGALRVWENCTAPLVPGEGSCPAAAGACVDPSQLRTGMYVRAWNPLDAENLAQAQADCEAEGKTWVAPWVPDI